MSLCCSRFLTGPRLLYLPSEGETSRLDLSALRVSRTRQAEAAQAESQQEAEDLPPPSEDLRKLVDSAKFAALRHSPSAYSSGGMSFMQAGAGLIFLVAVGYSGMKYFKRDSRVTNRKIG